MGGIDATSFIARWSQSAASERANAQPFLSELCDLLGVPRPDPKTGDRDKDAYVFEADAELRDEGGRVRLGRSDLYKRDHVLIECKQGSDEDSSKIGMARRGTPAWNVAMMRAYGQAIGYALSKSRPPPFLIVCDVGYCFDLYACFDGSGNYRPFPNAPRQRLYLKDLAEEGHQDTLRRIFLDPLGLDPSLRAAKVTREVAARLAELGRALEEEKHPAELVAQFLMRCLFTMFAEDVGLLPRHLFSEAIEKFWIPSPRSFPGGITSLWRSMKEGTDFGFTGKLLRFNGELFTEPTALPLKEEHLRLLLQAAQCDWAEVEPAIFGTLLERALDPRERHRLGAHYTPRAYVERLVRPTIEDPLRAEWTAAQAQAMQRVEAGKVEDARSVVRAFHRHLCEVRVLDPACGTGNFLYVTLDVFKRLEGEVLGRLESWEIDSSAWTFTASA